MQHTHSDRLERWLGPEATARLSAAVHHWYGPPIAVDGVPGNVFACGGGDFIGAIQAGQEMSKYDRLADMVKRERRRRVAAVAHGRRQLGAFGSLDAILAAATAGKYQDLRFNKTGVASNAIGNTNDLWTAAGFPAAGAAGGASPGGSNWTSASAGAMPYTNPATASSLQPVSGWATASVINNTLLLYDRLHSVVKTMNSNVAQAVNGVPSRYQSNVAGNVESAEGSFYFPSNPTTILAATAHNWTVCQYTNSAGTAGRSSPSIAGVSACVVGGVDLVANSWFMPLQAGDVGVQKMTQLQCSAAVATGTIDFTLGHALAFMPCPVAQFVCTFDWLYTAFRAVKIVDNAALALLELLKPATTATTYNGNLFMVAE
jgi:hypothetical protein